MPPPRANTKTLFHELLVCEGGPDTVNIYNSRHGRLLPIHDDPQGLLFPKSRLQARLGLLPGAAGYARNYQRALVLLSRLESHKGVARRENKKQDTHHFRRPLAHSPQVHRYRANPLLPRRPLHPHSPRGSRPLGGL